MFTTADVQYEIDVTQPLGSRIKNLSYLGKPMDTAQEL
jgi:2',3'-cyclic-nucleotide 2'-phosphodiesterase/3'-nucleotidase